jgi:hypothetical protein
MSDTSEVDDKKRQRWRQIDPSIWGPAPPRGRMQRVVERVRGALGFFSFGSLVVLGPFFIFLSILVIYDLVGAAYFGPALISFWAFVTVGFVLVLEKTGHAKNFESSDFPLAKERLLALPLAFAIIIAILLFLYFALAKIPR